MQIGLRKCYACRGPAFTVRKGTVFEDSHLPLRAWLQAIHLLCASKKGISTRQLQRMLGCGMKTAWHLGHRIRLAMDPGYTGPMGGEGKTVEIDDMELGRSPKTRKHPDGRKRNMKILSLIERGGPIRSVVLDRRPIGPRLYKHLDRNSRLVVIAHPCSSIRCGASTKRLTSEHFKSARGDIHQHA